MAVTAITGDIGSGKSTASHILCELLGCGCLDADVLAKSLWLRPDVKARAVERWGAGVLGPDGGLVLPAVAGHIFSSQEEHEFCCRLIHPLVMAELWERVQELGDVVVEVPLLPEAGRPEWVDAAVYVTAPFEVRVQRCSVRGWDSQELVKRERFLMPQSQRMAVCDVVVHNDGDMDSLRRQMEDALGPRAQRYITKIQTYINDN